MLRTMAQLTMTIALTAACDRGSGAGGTPTPPPSAEGVTQGGRCEPAARGDLDDDHPYIGKRLSALRRDDGWIVCRSPKLVVAEVGELCNNITPFHNGLTLELRGGVIQRVWVRLIGNERFCSEPGEWSER